MEARHEKLVRAQLSNQHTPHGLRIARRCLRRPKLRHPIRNARPPRAKRNRLNMNRRILTPRHAAYRAGRAPQAPRIIGRTSA